MDKFGAETLIPLDQICHYLRISPRSLRRKFKEKVGLGPKYYIRICRFHHILRLSHATQDLDVQDLAFLGGYHDLSHFTKDFKLFTGKTPFDYFMNNNRNLELAGVLQ